MAVALIYSIYWVYLSESRHNFQIFDLFCKHYSVLRWDKPCKMWYHDLYVFTMRRQYSGSYSVYPRVFVIGEDQCSCSGMFRILTFRLY